jgi:hypothetical protein
LCLSGGTATVGLSLANEVPTPDEEEARLLADGNKCHELSLAARAALFHPLHSIIDGSEAHQKLLEANATARLRYVAARTARHAYRSSSPTK